MRAKSFLAQKLSIDKQQKFIIYAKLPLTTKQSQQFEVILKDHDSQKVHIKKPIEVPPYKSDTGLFLKIDEKDIDVSDPAHKISIITPRFWKENKFDDLILFDLEIRNSAISGIGEISLKKLFLTINESDSDGIVFKSKNQWDNCIKISYDNNGLFWMKRLSNLNEIFNNKEKGSRIIIKDGQAPIWLTFSVLNADIEALGVKEALITLNLSLEFDVIPLPQVPNSNSTIEVETSVDLKIRKDLGPEWLAIDFGTSAIVAAFGDDKASSDKELQIIPLKNQIKELYKHEGGIEFQNEKDIERNEKNLELQFDLGEDPEFLDSSVIFLRKEKPILGNDYLESFINLTPKKTELAILKEFLERGIPYLKSLIGARNLIQVNENLHYFPYINRSNERTMVTEANPKISDVLEATYSSFLKNFIIPSPNVGGGRVNKIVVTVPNSFTPVHLNQLKSSIYKALYQVDEENIEFISESDAIAFRYFNTKRILCRNRDPKITKRISEKREEYVLAYDIGAGTSDLTYFKIETKELNSFEKQKISIIGRMSHNKAGNYFDFKIAKAIENLKNKKGNSITIEKDLETKLFIKNDLKPILAKYSQSNIPNKIINISDNLLEEKYNPHILKEKYNPHEILKPLSETFKDITERLFDKFFQLFQPIEDKGAEFKGPPKLDTVLITGRSSQFVMLQDYIEDSLKKITFNKDLYFIKYSENKFQSGFGNLTRNELKRMGVLGALNYVTQYRNQRTSPVIVEKNRLQAKYGLLYGNFSNFDVDWKFEELLSPQTKADEKIIIDPITDQEIHTYSKTSDVLNILHDTHFLFVQTYEESPEKAFFDLDKNDYNNEYIIEMFQFTKEQLRGITNIRLKITLDDRNEISLRVLGNNNQTLISFSHNTPLKTNLLTSGTFLDSMWPFIREVEKDRDKIKERKEKSEAWIKKAEKVAIKDPFSEIITRPDRYDLFIFYNTEDKTKVGQLFEALQAEGIAIWWDHYEVGPDEDRAYTIENGMEVSKAILVCLSNVGFSEKEEQLIQFAQKNGKKIIPVVVSEQKDFKESNIPDIININKSDLIYSLKANSDHINKIFSQIPEIPELKAISLHKFRELEKYLVKEEVDKVFEVLENILNENEHYLKEEFDQIKQDYKSNSRYNQKKTQAQLNEFLNKIKSIKINKFEKINEQIREITSNISNLNNDKKLTQYNNLVKLRQELLHLYENKEEYSTAKQTRKDLESAIKSRDLQFNIVNPGRLEWISVNDVNFFGDFTWQFQPNINILLGKNGYGKSHLLRLIALLLKNDYKEVKEFVENDNEANIKLQIARRKRFYEVQVDKKAFQKSIGQVPVLAIPDLRFFDRSERDLEIKSEKIESLVEEGSWHFLNRQPINRTIENFLYKLCEEYDETKNFDSPIFELITKVFYELTGAHFEFKEINRKEGSSGDRYNLKVVFEGDPNNPINIQDGSQGASSILSIIGLIYQFLKELYFDPSNPNVNILEKPAIVLIDELDAHLHPSWQQKIINILRNNFPNVQFIIVAHSPLIVAGCRSGEVSVLRKNNNKFSLIQYSKNFMGYDANKLYPMLFEISNEDEDFQNYSLMIPFEDIYIEEKNKLEETNPKNSQIEQRLSELNFILSRIRIAKSRKEENQFEQLKLENYRLKLEIDFLKSKK